MGYGPIMRQIMREYTKGKEKQMTQRYAHELAMKIRIRELKKILKPGTTIYCMLRHVSQSGMQREISLFKMTKDGPIDLDYRVSEILERRIGKHGGIVIGGCGMDMGFALVHELSYKLYPNGFKCTGKKCPSNDHSNYPREECPKVHKSGGYAFKHSWM